MALDIGIGEGDSFCPMQDELCIQIDDGYYWFLHSLFEDLAAETGQYIDLYGDASFSGKHMDSMDAMLTRAHTMIESQPGMWDVCIGSELVPYQRAPRSRPYLEVKNVTVNKSSFVRLVTQWKRIVARAKELNRPVVCFGD